ncbi:hypothetical protein H2203_005325 [Taxawa tesnikishii (nom. ined.)]|nr:hypothetical protein H2203_005325 [Dothideales sp. JES 119]
MRLLGDEYIKSEFRAHRNVDNPVHIIGFLSEWQMYAQQIEGDLWKGEKMDKNKIDKMSDQQLGQLYELMNTIRAQELEENDPELTLKEPCRPGRNLLTCPDFSARQPDGPATLWDMPCKRAPPRTCPWCDFNGDYDMGRIRVVKVKTVGFRIGTGPGRNDEGVDVFCCTVM